MPQKTLEDIRNDWIDHIGEKVEKFGFPRIAGQLEGLLFLSAKPMSLDEMAARLEVSKASVSTNIRVLERWKVLKRAYHRGERKNYYEIRGKVWEIETEVLSTLVKEEMERAQHLLDQTASDLKTVRAKSKDEKSELQYMRERMEEFKEYFEAVSFFLGQLMKQKKITPAVVKKIRVG